MLGEEEGGGGGGEAGKTHEGAEGGQKVGGDTVQNGAHSLLLPLQMTSPNSRSTCSSRHVAVL